MPALSPEEHQRRLDTYNDWPYLSDSKMAEKLGIPQATFSDWRAKNDLPAHKTYRQSVTKLGVPMAAVLTPQQCAVMKSFLNHLIATYEYGRKHRKQTPDVISFARTWQEVVA